jgi:hypothetical protein
MTDYELKETEKFFLSCLMEAAKHKELSTDLAADDFIDRVNGSIFTAIVKQYQDGKTPDLSTIHAEFPTIEAAKLADVTNGSWTYTNIKHYESIIKAESKTRLAMKAFKIALEELNRADTDTDTVIKNILPSLEGVLSTRNESRIKTAAQLLKMEFPPIKWIVDGLIGDGMTMIVGAPKIGKSWFVLGLALAAAQKGRFLGQLPAAADGVLYLALEDTDRRLQNRLKKMGATQIDNFHITTQWNDGLIGLKNYLSSHRDINLVIIDTLARFANIEDMNAYAETTNALAGIKRIADDLKIAIVVIHHAGKGKNTRDQFKKGDWMEAALGSTGLTGATDSTIYIFRDRENGEGQTGTKKAGELRVTGRDSADQKYKLVFDGTIGSWTIDNQASPGATQGKGNSPSKSKGENSHVE